MNDEKKDDKFGDGFALGLVMGLLSGGFLIGAVQHCSEVKPLKASAVEKGAAEWVVDPKDGTTQFRWKEKK